MLAILGGVVAAFAGGDGEPLRGRRLSGDRPAAWILLPARLAGVLAVAPSRWSSRAASR